MRFYTATRHVFPRNYALRIFATCFAAVHVPIITYGVFAAMRGTLDWGVFLALLAATVAGSAFGILGLAGLLKPMTIATQELRKLQNGEKVGAIPAGGPDMAGELLASVAMAAEATGSQLDRMREAALTDTLTGLRNRRGFESAVDQALLGGRSGTLAILDGDEFKQVNDRLGHAEGDKVLRGFARRIAGIVRPGDIAARWGGDEFVIFFPGLKPPQAEELVARIRSSLIAQPDAEIDGTPVAFSFGLTALESRGNKALTAAMKTADANLYAQKDLRKAGCKSRAA